MTDSAHFAEAGYFVMPVDLKGFEEPGSLRLTERKKKQQMIRKVVKLAKMVLQAALVWVSDEEEEAEVEADQVDLEGSG